MNGSASSAPRGASATMRTRGGARRSGPAWSRSLLVGVLALTVAAAIACVPPVEEPPASTVIVTASSSTVEYGETATVTPSYSGLPSGVTAPATPPTCTSTATPTSAPGTYVSSCSGGAGTNLTFIYLEGAVTVEAAPVVVTASSGSMEFGASAPTISADYDGLKNGETAPATPATCSTDATSTSALGDYPSRCADAADPNYTFTYVDGTVTVAAAVVTVTASSATSTYGDAPAAVTASYTGFVNGETAPATPATCSTDATAASDVGSYDTECSAAADPSYAFDYVDGTHTVTPAAATVTASSASISVGDAIPAITASYSGLVNGDTEPATPATCSTTATPGSPAGIYDTVCTGADDTNFTFAYAPGSLTIVPGIAPVTVTASSATIAYGEAVPAVVATFSGFTGGQTGPDGDPAVCSTDATSTSPVGTYTTTCSGATDSGHSFSYVDGTVTVVPATATVTASSATSTYGDALPAIAAGYSGLVNGDTEPATPATCAADPAAGSGAGTFATSCSAAADPNYSFNYVDGSIVVAKAAAVVIASSATTSYGAALPAITASYTGLVNGDTEPATPATCAADATPTSGVGSYDTGCADADDANYTFSYVGGTLTVGTAAVTVTASSDSMVEGDAVPSVTAGYVGLAAGETAPATPASCSTTATSASPVGSYVSSCSGAADANYTFDYVDGVTTVTEPVKIPVTVTASSATMGVGESTVPTVTASYSGLTGGDTEPETPATCTTTVKSFSPVGSYATTCSGAADDAYEFTYVAGTLTVSANGFGTYKSPAIATTVAGASIGQSLPQANINVAAGTPAGFNSNGYINLTVHTSAGGQTVFCEGVAGTNFGGCSGGTGTMTADSLVTDAPAHVFDVYTLVPGGKAAVTPSSLTILSDVPAAARASASKVTATANNGLISYYQSQAPSGTFSLTFGICSTGTATYSAGDANCRTGKIFYSPAVGALMGNAVVVIGVTSNQYQTISVGTTGAADVAQGETFTTFVSPAGSAVPKKAKSGSTVATVKTTSTFTSIYPIPAGMTYQSASLIGGDAKTSGVATVKYCPANGTGCTAKLNTGSYDDTTLPYIQVTLPTATKINAGELVTMPTLALTMTATGAPGTVGNLSLTEFVNVTVANFIIDTTATFDGYPTTGSNTGITPPNGPKVTLFSTEIN